MFHILLHVLPLQSLVPNNFTIINLVYMMCDNKEILFDVLLYSQNNLSLLSMT